MWTRKNSIPFWRNTAEGGSVEQPLTQNIRPGEQPLDLRGYERAGGYQALRQALQRKTPKQVQEEATQANLRSRGGAGFPTGMQCSFVPMGDGAPHPKYLIVK